MTVLKLAHQAPQTSKIIGGIIGINGVTTTISIPVDMYKQMLHFAHDDASAVSDACRYAARKAIKAQAVTESNFSKVVRDKALATLRGGYIPEREIKQQLVAMYHENEEAVKQLLKGAA